MALQNCTGCGKLMGETPSGFCDNCKGTDPTYSNLHKVRDYLYDNPNTSIKVVSEDTGVSVSEISKYIRDGSIREITGFSPAGGGKCSCGKPLEGSERICKECKRDNDRNTERVKKELSKKVSTAADVHAASEKGGFYTKQK